MGSLDARETVVGRVENQFAGGLGVRMPRVRCTMKEMMYLVAVAALQLAAIAAMARAAANGEPDAGEWAIATIFFLTAQVVIGTLTYVAIILCRFVRRHCGTGPEE